MKRQLNNDEKKACNNGIERLKIEKTWAQQEREIFILKLDQWEVTKSILKHNVKKNISQLEMNLEEAKKMVACDFETNKQNLIKDIGKLDELIKTNCDKQIKTLHDQVRNGVIIKDVKK